MAARTESKEEPRKITCKELKKLLATYGVFPKSGTRKTALIQLVKEVCGPDQVAPALPAPTARDPVLAFQDLVRSTRDPDEAVGYLCHSIREVLDELNSGPALRYKNAELVLLPIKQTWDAKSQSAKTQSERKQIHKEFEERYAAQIAEEEKTSEALSLAVVNAQALMSEFVRVLISELYPGHSLGPES